MKRKPELLDGPEPSAVESEKALLAGFMLAGRVNPDCDLRRDHFYDPRNAVIYGAMADLDAELGQWDSTALLGRLRGDPLWERDGFNAGYVGEIALGVGNPAIAREAAPPTFSPRRR